MEELVCWSERGAIREMALEGVSVVVAVIPGCFIIRIRQAEMQNIDSMIAGHQIAKR